MQYVSESRLSFSLSLHASVHSLCVRQRLSAENGARVPKHVQMINIHSMVVKLIYAFFMHFFSRHFYPK